MINNKRAFPYTSLFEFCSRSRFLSALVHNLEYCKVIKKPPRIRFSYLRCFLPNDLGPYYIFYYGKRRRGNSYKICLPIKNIKTFYACVMLPQTIVYNCIPVVYTVNIFKP